MEEIYVWGKLNKVNKDNNTQSFNSQFTFYLFEYFNKLETILLFIY